MKIVHIINSLGVGGAEETLSKLCYYDKRNEHLIISLTSATGRHADRFRRNGLKVVGLDLHSGLFYAVPRLLRALLFIRSERPNIIQTWLYHGDLIGSLLAVIVGNIKVVWNIRNQNTSLRALKPITAIVVRVNALLSHIVPDAIISCSLDAQKSHVKIGFSKKKFSIIYNGFDFDIIHPVMGAKNRICDELSLKSDVPLLGTVARYDRQKDIPTLLRALHMVALKCDFIYILVGRGMVQSNDELVKLIEMYSLSERVLLLGQLEDIPQIMSCLDIHVLSSLGEAFPNVIVEAMACGVPCISSDVGDAKYIIDGTGWIFKSGDYHALSNAICNALELVDQTSSWLIRKKLVRRKVLERFYLDRMIFEYNNLWDSVVEGNSPGH